jgi:hypothetical protein
MVAQTAAKMYRTGRNTMARNNYSFAKRQKELAKKKKKEEKRLRKLEKKNQKIFEKTGVMPPSEETGQE